MDQLSHVEMEPVRTVSLRSRQDFVDYFESTMRPRLAVEELIGSLHAEDENWLMPGFCRVCRRPSSFQMDWVSSAKVPNFRERMICDGCGLSNRQRFVASFLMDSFSAAAASGTRLYMYEQTTAFFSFVEKYFEDVDVIGSEYLGAGHAPGEEIRGIRHEDALNLTFADASLNAIVSNDVYEHVPDIDLALLEASRVLKPGGLLIFTIPFHSNSDETVQRARLGDGEIEMLLEPEYHGNPVDPVNGSLVFYDHGWDILDRCLANGFSDAQALGYYDPLFGHIGGGLQILFVAERAVA